MYKTLLEQIGNTPLVKIDLGLKTTLLAKLEYMNPGGSIKDRAALYMVEDAENKGLLKPGGTIVEATSGNQGIALAMIGVLKGYKVVITVPKHTSHEKVDALRAYGAEVHVCPDTDTLEDPSSYHSVAERLHESIDGAFMPNQYFSIVNVEAHYHSTGPEIWRQTNGTITHFFAGMGSCGTISGVGRYLKEQNPNIKVVGIDSAHSLLSAEKPKAYEVEGIGVDVISDTFNKEVVDHIIPIHDAEAFKMTRQLASKGMLVGVSSGAVMHGIFSYMPNIKSTDIVVAILADSGRAYLGKVFSQHALFQENAEVASQQKQEEVFAVRH
ncbi:cysteine synthase family protein [Oligoflexia bacterium]|nr:cysteine synthase family protein [Oligoflexia bacterium]